jgi:hypothetical protein
VKVLAEGSLIQTMALMTVINQSPVMDIVGYVNGPHAQGDDQVRIEFEIQPCQGTEGCLSCNPL